MRLSEVFSLMEVLLCKYCFQGVFSYTCIIDILLQEYVKSVLDLT